MLMQRSEENMNNDWLFADPVNTVAITLRQIVQEECSILHVCHDDDGSWQFLGGGRGRVAGPEAFAKARFGMAR